MIAPTMPPDIRWLSDRNRPRADRDDGLLFSTTFSSGSGLEANRPHQGQPFGISFSTTWSMLKLAALARGGNSLKLSSHFVSNGGAAY